MPEFTCCVCQAKFEIPNEIVAHYRRWRPKYCAAHRYVGKMRSAAWLGQKFARKSSQLPAV